MFNIYGQGNRKDIYGHKQYIIKYEKNPKYVSPRSTTKTISSLVKLGVPDNQIINAINGNGRRRVAYGGRKRPMRGNGPLGDLVGLIPGPIGTVGKIAGQLLGLGRTKGSKNGVRKIYKRVPKLDGTARKPRSDIGIPRGPRRRSNIPDIQLIAPTLAGNGRRYYRGGQRGRGFFDTIGKALNSPIGQTAIQLGQTYKPATIANNFLNNSKYANTTAGKLGSLALNGLQSFGFGRQRTYRRSKRTSMPPVTSGMGRQRISGNGRRRQSGGRRIG